MKKIFTLRTALVVVLVMCWMPSLKAQLFYQDSHLFIGQKPNNWNSVGSAPGVYIGPNWGMEFSEGGLNIWRPHGSSNWGNYKLFIDQTGKIGIGRKPTTYALEVNGQVWTTQGLLITSDERLKRNIININSSYLSRLKRLHGKFYEKQIASEADRRKEVETMIAQGKISKENAQSALAEPFNLSGSKAYKKEFGFIAQEVKELFPELVEQDAEGIYAVNYTGLIPVLVEAIKELQARVETLENQGQISFKSGEATTTNEKILDTEEYLSQNVPNPVNGNARIDYTLPEGTTSAAIALYSINGTQVKNIPLDVHGRKGSITVSSADFASGLHIYKLIANGVVVGTKKLVNK